MRLKSTEKSMSTRHQTQICITVGTEFDVNDSIENPELTPIAEPIVLGRFGGKEEGQGFLLDSFAKFGVQPTFFVEALQTAYFGDEPMGSIAIRIAEPGYDMQLHLHPGWLHYDAVARALRRSDLVVLTLRKALGSAPVSRLSSSLAIHSRQGVLIALSTQRAP